MAIVNCINFFTFIDNICTELGTKAYLWGGWIPDVYSGKVLRKHNDAEHLVKNLYQHRSKMQSVFNALDWETKIVENNDLIVKKYGIKFQFGHLEIKQDRAAWFHNGSKGKIIFPKKWLNDQVVLFQDNRFHTVTPEFQYVLKLHPEYMNSGWVRRKKDKEDAKILKALLSQRYSSLKSLEANMSSK